MERAFRACAVPGGPVSLTTCGIQIEELSRNGLMVGGRGMDISPEHAEDVDMTAAEFCKLLIGLADAGWLASFWSGKVRVSYHIGG